MRPVLLCCNGDCPPGTVPVELFAGDFLPRGQSPLTGVVMEIDRRAFIASLGGAAVVDAMCPEAKAEALEHHLSDLLDESLGFKHEEQVVPAAPEATVRRGAGTLFTPQGPAE